MKLLFDHNLSPQLANRFAGIYPGSQHVFLLGMDQVDDRQIWGRFTTLALAIAAQLIST
jgi:predicted nuclease of predicted toxin-antitoxin system